MKVDHANEWQIEIKDAMDRFLEKRRPPRELRDEVDLGYKIEKQSIVMFEIRPRFNVPEETIESYVAKAVFVKKSNHWKLYWMRADLKWHIYGPKPAIDSIESVVKVVDEDQYNCFFG